MRSIERDGTPNRVALSLRVAPEIHARLIAAAQETGRSLTTEIENRLSRTFERQSLAEEAMQLLFGEGFAGLLLIVGRAMQDAGFARTRRAWEKRAKEDADVEDTSPWWMDPDGYDAAMAVANRVLEEFRPSGDRILGRDDPELIDLERYAVVHIAPVVEQGAPHPPGRRQWIELARALLGPDLVAQSHWLKKLQKENAAIMAARAAQNGALPDASDDGGGEPDEP